MCILYVLIMYLNNVLGCCRAYTCIVSIMEKMRLALILDMCRILVIHGQ